MKKALLAALAVLTVSCASGPAPAEKKAAAPVTPVPSFKEVVYEEGIPLQVTTLYPNGDVSGIVKNRYSDKGYLVSQETFNGNGVLLERRVGSSKGGVWRVAVYNAQNNELVAYQDLQYSASGELLSETFLNLKEEPQSSNEYTYKEGRKTEWLAKTGAGNLQAKTVYTYDAKGNNTQIQVYDGGGKLTNSFENTLSADGHLLSKKGLDAGGSIVELTNYTWSGDLKTKEETIKPVLKVLEYEYAPGKVSPSVITTSVRGKVVEKQNIEYQWVKKTKKIPV